MPSRQRAVQTRWQKAGIEANSAQVAELSECEHYEKVLRVKMLTKSWQHEVGVNAFVV